MKSKENLNQKSPKAWLVAVSMGYGHQRTAYALKDLSPDGKIINANDYPGMSEKDKLFWGKSQKFYEFISNFRNIPLIGKFLFRVYDQFQKIFSFYPRRDLSRSNFVLRQIFSLLKKGWGINLIEALKKNPLSLITTFFTVAFMAEFFNYPGEIYCVICDADISRTWAPLNPSQSRIKYLASTQRSVERLALYGVKKENIILTGFPLPKENIGSTKLETAKNDLSHRILNLDSKGIYRQQYASLIKKYIGELPKKSNHPLTIMFAIGGAGAQKEIGDKIMESLADKIKKSEVRIILSAGIREKIKNYFFNRINELKLQDWINKNIEIIWAEDLQSYFQKFSRALRTTDILWSKPSELSFYSALGIPFVMAPTIGSQEDFNREWLLEVGSGINQKDPRYTNQWLFDLLESGWFAEAAMQGFIEIEKLGAFHIEKIIQQHYAVAHH